ncbi:histidinol-phosphate transaminase [Methyloversatilis thermotolerans]|uniref:histidinol-phosphate transaminase n=1 Tax=Methyloversatilis thermotolerans TaxID=1346290 RepID=UPI00036A9269|nr:histidinol-phosphate transaminase [Methyloversatilis thermotolerans]
MSVFERAAAHIRSISPYQPGKPISELAREMRLDEEGIVKLASNENPLGMSERAKAAALAAIADVPRYPDGNGFDLKQAVARHHDVDMSQIVLGNGSNDVLEMVARALLGAGRSAVYSKHAFAVYPLATLAAGAAGIEVPACDFGCDLDAMRAAIRDDTRVVFIANPNNPTGTFIEARPLERFVASVPHDVLVVLDEAYSEYLPASLAYDSARWLARYPNLLVSRTFSKAYGLAGLRVGYGLGQPDVIDLLNRVRQPFNVTSVGLAAAAAALADQDFVRRSAELNAAGLKQLAVFFDGAGIGYIPSYANFVAFRVGDGAAVNQRLLQQGVIVRPIAGYAMPEWLRVSIGLESENARFIEGLQKALA